jgi:uncharacterized protein
MLVVDLNRVAREGRARIDADVPADAAFWNDTDVEPRSPLSVRLEAQQAGPDVVVRGTVRGEFELACRRCLDPVVAGVDEELGLLYKAGELEEDEAADVLPLPAGAELDLSEPVRELLLLAVPRYMYCREDCKGLCPECGTNWNEAACECAREETDERWAPLRELKRDA